MEPIHPALRAELKRAHSGLTDADIDQYEELTSLRFTLDPTAAAEQIREIDIARALLIKTRMPQLAAVENAFVARRAATQAGREAPRIEVKSARRARDYYPTADGSDSQE